MGMRVSRESLNIQNSRPNVKRKPAENAVFIAAGKTVRFRIQAGLQTGAAMEPQSQFSLDNTGFFFIFTWTSRGGETR
jgi:hypothetical protein